MNALLERILNIIANDAFPDEDKPYIIREIVAAWNEAKDGIPRADETRYDEEYVDKIKKEAYHKGYKNGTEAGSITCNQLTKPIRKAAYNKGYEEGIAQGKQEFHRHAAERYRSGVQDGRNEIVEIINNLRTPE